MSSTGFELKFSPLPPLPGEVPASRPPWQEQERKRPRSPPSAPSLQNAFEEAAFDSMWNGDDQPRRAPDSVPAPAPYLGTLFRSIEGNHSGLLREYGGVREWMLLVSRRKPPPKVDAHEPPSR